VINPDASGVLNSYAIVVENTSKSQVLDNYICCVDDSDTIPCNGSIAPTDERLIGTNSESCWEAEFTFNDNVQPVGSLSEIISFCIPVHILS
jgi:hypothetical protein